MRTQHPFLRLSLLALLALGVIAAAQDKGQPTTAPFNVLDYGAKLDGITDAAPAIQRAIDAAIKGNGGEVRIPAGRYLLRSGLRILQADPTKPIHLKGEGFASLLYFQREKPTAKVDEAIRVQNSSGTSVTGLALFCERNRGFTHGLHITARQIDGKNGSNQHTTITKVLSDGFPIAFGVGTGTDNDTSETSFYDCVGSGTDSGWLLGGGVVSNVINARMFGCEARRSKYGVRGSGCNFCWYGGTVQYNTDSDFYISGPNTAPFVIDGVRSEMSNRFFTFYGGNQFMVPVSIRSCYVTAWTDPEGIVIRHTSNSPLSLSDTVFALAKTPAKFQIGIGTPRAPRGSISLSNVGVNNPRPLIENPGLGIRNFGLYQVNNDNGGFLGPCVGF